MHWQQIKNAWKHHHYRFINANDFEAEEAMPAKSY
mgnify:CR=1 FL=1